MSITPLDSIRRAIARRNGVADPAVSGEAHGQGGRIENGLFPASHTAEELARIQELSQRNAGGPDSSQAAMASPTPPYRARRTDRADASKTACSPHRTPPRSSRASKS